MEVRDAAVGSKVARAPLIGSRDPPRILRSLSKLSEFVQIRPNSFKFSKGANNLILGLASCLEISSVRLQSP